MSDGNNQFVLPRVESRRIVCAKCGKSDWWGRVVQGSVTAHCNACGHQWQMGMAREPMDPRLPRPPENPKDNHPVHFAADSQGKAVELRRRVDATPDFKKGAPIPPDGEDNG